MSRIFLERRRFIVDLLFTNAGALFYVGNTWKHLRKSFTCEMPRKTMFGFVESDTAQTDWSHVSVSNLSTPDIFVTT